MDVLDVRREADVARTPFDVFVRVGDEVDVEAGVCVEVGARVLSDGGRDAEEGDEGGERKGVLGAVRLNAVQDRDERLERSIALQRVVMSRGRGLLLGYRNEVKIQGADGEDAGCKNLVFQFSRQGAKRSRTRHSSLCR